METKTHICPVWIGYIMASPLRKLQQNPNKILSPYINKGMKILEIGPAMGFFSIPMAQITGTKGRVFCVDIQQKMLKKLEHRAYKAGVGQTIETRLSTDESMNIADLENSIDFTLLAFVAHEIEDQEKLFGSLSAAMKNKSSLLFIEPKGHVSTEDWEKSLAIATAQGFQMTQKVNISGSRSALLCKA